MSTEKIPDAAVQIAATALRDDTPLHRWDVGYASRAVVDALARAGWLHDPAEVAALRAVADAVKTALVEGYPLHPDVRKAYGAIVVARLHEINAQDQP